jgi:hypothetical protein
VDDAFTTEVGAAACCGGGCGGGCGGYCGSGLACWGSGPADAVVARRFICVSAHTYSTAGPASTRMLLWSCRGQQLVLPGHSEGQPSSSILK